MNFPVRPHDQQLEFSVALVPFITDWPSATQKFLAGIASKFSGLARAQDFRVNSSGSLGDVSCICQLYGGACVNTLNPSELRLSFTSVNPQAYPAVFSTTRTSLDWLASDFSGHKQDWLHFRSNEHVQLLQDMSANNYLNQFAQPKIMEALASESGVSYQSSVRIALSDTEQTWSLNRLVEKSLQISDGLFVSTNISISLSQASGTDYIEQLTNQLSAIADRAVGLSRGKA